MSYKVLVVDDEEEILEEANEALTEEGYQCFSAINVDDALAILRENLDITLVVTDLKMPGKTGGDLIAEARATFDRSIKFIIMSGHGSPTIKTDGVDFDSMPFLRKPLDIDAFLEMVERLAVSMDGKPKADGGTKDK